MIARDRPPRSSRSRKGELPSFELRRFAWGAPDRLELAGVFAGLDAPPGAPPVLVLSGAERTHRLPAATDDVSGVPENGRPWQAAFVWQEAPAAFQAATLELGPKLAVELPEPGADGAAPGKLALTLRSGLGEAPAGGSRERLRLEGDLLAVQEELREATAAAHRAQSDLSRARSDLDAEREGRAADAARFRDGLAQMGASAEAALAVEQATSRRLGDELKAALEAAEAKESELRLELDTAEAVWTESRSEAEAEIATLRARVEELEQGAAETEAVRAELAAARAGVAETRRQIQAAVDALEQARAGAERLAAEPAADDDPPADDEMVRGGS